jgi:hypothetical protein
MSMFSHLALLLPQQLEPLLLFCPAPFQLVVHDTKQLEDGVALARPEEDGTMTENIFKKTELACPFFTAQIFYSNTQKNRRNFVSYLIGVAESPDDFFWSSMSRSRSS